MVHGLWDEIEKYVWGAVGKEDFELIEPRYSCDSEELTLTEPNTHRREAGMGETTPDTRHHDTNEPREDPSQRNIHLESSVVDPAPSYVGRSVRSAPQVVNEDVEQIKEMYILGKRVGKDIVDQGGRLTARRGDRITREIMQESERVGKLVELIVNMTFDRGGEGQHE